MPVDFLENKPEHRRVDKRLCRFAYIFGAIAREVVSVKKFQQVTKCGQLFVERFLPVFEHCAAVEGNRAVVETADSYGFALQFADFKQGAV